jgi:hypothetical protein
MFRVPPSIAFILCLLLSPALSALEPSGSGSFEKSVPGTATRVPITRATLSDLVSYKIVVTADVGGYPILVTIYDGGGREAFRAESKLPIGGGTQERILTYSYDKSKDAPGTWWYVVAVSGKVVLSNSIEVTRQ